MVEVWIVDDDEFYQNYLSMFLNISGYKTRCFGNGEDCLEQLQLRPWAILLDRDLGASLNGAEVLREIKKREPNIPVITISGIDRAEIAAEAINGGSADYIRKDSASLIRLKLMLDRLKKIDQLREQKARYRKNIYIACFGAAILITALAIWFFTR